MYVLSSAAGAPTLSLLIPICFGIMVIAFLAKPLRLLLRFLFSAAMGGVGLWLCHNFGLAVGINPATLAITGFLGLPGLLGLVALSLLL